MSVQQYAALIAWYTKKPVKVKYSRQESLDYHVKRHPMEMEFTTACDENGHLTAMKGVIIADTGAYASLYRGKWCVSLPQNVGPFRMPLQRGATVTVRVMPICGRVGS